MKKILTIAITIAAAFCAAETMQSITVPAGSASASWTNIGSRVYIDKIMYVQSAATTTNETLTFTVSYVVTGTLASNSSAVAVSLPNKVLVASNTVVIATRTAATTNTTGSAVLVFE